MANQAWISTVIIAICLTQVATCVKYVNVQCGIDWSVCVEKLISINCRFYWNIPTFMCRRHGFDFTNITADYGIIQNENDGFR